MRFAPVDGPDQRPSSFAARLAISKASPVGTVRTSLSKSSRWSSGGQKPDPPPSMRCVPGEPPESTGDSAGSIAMRTTPGSAFRSSRVTPTKQPDVPTYVQNASMRPSSCSSSSRPRLAYPSSMSRFRNWSVAKPSTSSTISFERSIIRGMSSGVIPSGLDTISTSAPNARIVKTFSCANASEVTIRSG